MKRYTHLSSDERTLISHYRDSGLSKSAIALLVGRSKSTISRELARNTLKTEYSPQKAQNLYLFRRQKASLLETLPALRAFAMDRLLEGFSPESIAIRLKNYGHIEGLPSISHEAIYQWLYKPAQKKQRLFKLLVRHHAKRGRRKRLHRGQIKDRVSINERPEHVHKRQDVGHWEADLMSFQGNRQHMLVIHERKTRYTVALRLASKSAQETLQKLLAFLSALPKKVLKSITFDNGLEFSFHDQIRQKLGIPTYFCDVYASWQKGGIENMNGRLRRDFPRKTDLYALKESEIELILTNHNIMPRKCLNAKSPFEALANQLGHNIIFSFTKGVALQI